MRIITFVDKDGRRTAVRADLIEALIEDGGVVNINLITATETTTTAEPTYWTDENFATCLMKWTAALG